MSRADVMPVADRAALVARWYALTRDELPGMAVAQRWPIQLDHCFMRVCLDAVFGSPWTAVLQRPAVAHAAEADLARAILVAESIVAEPARLRPLNEASLAGRRARAA